MKRLISLLLSVSAAITLLFAPAAMAADLANGKTIFSQKCASCHMGGNNVIDSSKTLKQADLSKNGKDSLEAVMTQVTNGKNAMPAFGTQLSASEIEDVASYVLDQAANGW